MVLWRISNHVALDGAGGLYAAGRWHSQGQRIIYCAEHPAAALLEAIVHSEIDIEDWPRSYKLLKVGIGPNVRRNRIAPDSLPPDWKRDTAATRRVGDLWLASGKGALLYVPSSIVPETYNVLINPSRIQRDSIALNEVTEHILDDRLESRLRPTARP